MVKAHAPSTLTIGRRTVTTDALPDPFDQNDLVYRPRLQLLPETVDQRAGVPLLDQKGQSCTGHAVAALIDTVFAEPLAKTPEHGAPNRTTKVVSPYMLYAMARRYDEFPGMADVGSSLRGAFKGWYHHGVCPANLWTDAKPGDLTDRHFVAKCFEIPLGAYYRVNARRIDDMQSAIGELNGIAVSAAIHEGWRTPKQTRHRGGPIFVIEPSDQKAGGHAFLIAGYNDVGFLVQNSWGQVWGHKGYATLPYEDWLDNGYDAWVARPGVPQAGLTMVNRTVVPGGRVIVATSGTDLLRLKDFVVDVTAGGRLSDKGKVSSTPAQIRGLVDAMEAKQNLWVGGHPTVKERNVVLYAHGGLVGEDGGISIADRMIDWWMANEVYPVHIVWESDPLTTIFSILDHHQEGLPFGGWLDGAWEALDTVLEHMGRNIRPLWEQMKTNARAASDPLHGGAPETEPGVTLFLDRLQAYRQKHPNDMKIHLVGHSAGSVVLASTLERLVAMGIPIESLQLMGGAIRVDDFVSSVVTNLAGAPGGSGALKKFVAYDLKDKNELDDTCPANPAIYHKSLLYFVARSLEHSPTNNFEVPMAGLSKDMPVAYGMPDGSQGSLLNAIGGTRNLVVAPTSAGAVDERSQAHGHGEFDDDPDTMTSVILRIRNTQNLAAVTPYPKGGMHTP